MTYPHCYLGRLPLDVAPYITLQYLMDASGTDEEDLVGILGTYNQVHQAVQGELDISSAQATRLAIYFNVPPDLFM